MGTIKIETGNIVKPYVMDADTECELRIVSVREGTDKNGNAYIMPSMEVIGEIAAKEFSYFIGIPSSSMTEKQYNTAAYKYMQFCEAFGVDPSQENEIEDFVGLEAVGILGMKNDETYGEQNYVKSFVVGA